MPDVILAVSTTNLTIVRQATSTVPHRVRARSPIRSSRASVASLTKPGGNLTGFSM